MLTKVWRLILALLSAGWVVPLWMGTHLYLEFMSAEVWPRLAGRDPGNSFPYLRIASPCFTIAFVWLGIVILCWAFMATAPKSLTPDSIPPA